MFSHPRWEPYRLTWRFWWRLTLAKVLVALLLGLIPNNLAYPFPDERAVYGLEPVAPVIVALQRWEAFHYEINAADWYDQYPQYAIKAPLYPGMARALWLMTGQSLPLAWIMTLLHSLAVWFALAETYRFWSLEKSPEFARRALYWTLFPLTLAGLVWIFNYDEPLYIGLMGLTLTLIRRERFAWAGVVGSLLALSRPQGIIFAGLVGVFVIARNLRDGIDLETVMRRAVALMYPLFAWVMWAGILSQRTGMVFAPISVRAEEWAPAVWRWPWETLAFFLEGGQLYGWRGAHLLTTAQFVVIGLSLLVLAWAAWRKRLDWMLVVYAVLNVAIPTATVTFSIGRYAVPTVIPLAVLFLPESWQERLNIRAREPYWWAALALANLVLLLIVATRLNSDWSFDFVP